MQDVRTREKDLADGIADAPRIVILADDLSSAADCGVQMAQNGQRVVVPLGAVPTDGRGVDVLSLDVDSRRLPGQEAYAATRKTIEALSDMRGAVFYKSVDSTLRGNLGAEIAACLDSSRFGTAIVAPAFPTYGRTTVEGVQLLRGIPVSQTEFGSDPGSPVKTSAIVERISEQRAYAAKLIPLAMLRDSESDVRQAILNGMKRSDSLFVFDAVEEEDLRRVASVAAPFADSVLWVGSTGLSRYVPVALRLPRRAGGPKISAVDGIVLIVAGSASETTRRQLDGFARDSGFAEVEMDATAIARGGTTESREVARVRRALADAATAGKHAVALTLRSTRADIARTKALASERGETGDGISRRLVETLARLTAELLDRGPRIKGLILTGGATAKTVAAACGADAIAIVEEVEPGIPLASMGGRHGKLVVIKAGGFGRDDTLINAAKRIREYGRN